MGREEAREKGWNTFRENLITYAAEHPDFNLTEFIVERVNTSYMSWRYARDSEWKREFLKARTLYLKAIESLEQAEKIINYPGGVPYVAMLKDEYLKFVIHRDPYYRNTIKYVLPVIKYNPGILQTEVYKRFNADKSELSYAFYFAEKEGLIRREKKGRSYQLFFVQEKPADEPLLTIQWDEIDFQNKEKQEEAQAKQAEQAQMQVEEKKATKKGCLIVIVVIVSVLLCIFTGLIGICIVAVSLLVFSVVMMKKQKKLHSSEIDFTISDDKT